MARVFLVYGFSEGVWHGRKFRRVLKRRGHTIAPDTLKADYIIAHSGGCYTVPPLRDEQTLILVNPTYWPGRAVPIRAGNMVKQMIISMRPGNRPIFHFYKNLRNVGYLIRHHKANRFIAWRSASFNLEQEIAHKRTLLIRNHNDPWLTPDLERLQLANPHLQIAKLPGDHDDLWLHPEPYINLMEAYK
jgi:hypothetical protein